jgi:hypothetical protein
MVYREALLEQRCGSLVITLAVRDDPQLVQRPGDALPVACFPGPFEALLE